AAANLAEFGCPAPLAHALLTEPGLDSGLAPKEVRRQIDCGVEAKGGQL
ncbi:MAG: DNA primase, partial [Planctomycetes bacterium]|nr:DNA primase [Planctomycetota bacterium]